MIKIIFIISILFYSTNWINSLNVPIVTQSDDFREFANNVRNILAGDNSLQDLFDTENGAMIEAIDKIDIITQQIKNLDTNLYDLLAKIIAKLPSDNNVDNDISNLQDYMSKVDDVYNKFLGYSKNISNVDNNTLTGFITAATSTESDNIPDILKKMVLIIVPTRVDPYRMLFLENMKREIRLMDPLDKCNPEISYQNRLLQIYNLIAITELRAFLMTTFAYRLKNELEGVETRDQIDQTQGGFVQRLYRYMSVFKDNMYEASREIFLCDPESLTDQNTYVELEGLFTAYVINEYETNLDYDYPCYYTCPDISIWTHYRCYDINGPRNVYCPKHPCKGLVHKCGWIGGDVDICEYRENFLKRYDYVRSYTNGWYGKWSDCNAENMTYQQVNGRLNRGYRCDMCMCSCEESYGSSRAIRTFSLRPQISNIEENKVVSDVKFTLKDKMIHIQIEEAPLLPLGQLDKNQTSWVPLEDFIYLSNVTGGGWVQVKDGKYIPMTRDTDFAFIRSDQRVLNLDEISGGRKFILTGVRLNHESEIYSDDENAGNISPLQLEIHVTPFDYINGKLMPTERKPSVWLTPSTQPDIPPAYSEERKEHKMGPKVYKYESPINPPDLKANQFVQFQQSTIHDDVGQSTIPFMDSRPTAPSSIVALDGLGLAYRGHEDYGGFVLLKAMTMDFSNYME